MEHLLIAAREQRMLPTSTPADRQRVREALQAEIAELERAIGVLDFVEQSLEIDGCGPRGLS